MERALALRHLGIGEQVVEPVLEEQLLHGGGDGLVDGDVDKLAGAGDPRRVHGREASDRADEPGRVPAMSLQDRRHSD